MKRILKLLKIVFGSSFGTKLGDYFIKSMIILTFTEVFGKTTTLKPDNL